MLLYTHNTLQILFMYLIHNWTKLIHDEHIVMLNMDPSQYGSSRCLSCAVQPQAVTYSTCRQAPGRLHISLRSPSVSQDRGQLRPRLPLCWRTLPSMAGVGIDSKWALRGRWKHFPRRTQRFGYFSLGRGRASALSLFLPLFSTMSKPIIWVQSQISPFLFDFDKPQANPVEWWWTAGLLRWLTRLACCYSAYLNLLYLRPV